MNRIEKKWDIALWGIIYMLPIIIFITTNIRFMNGETTVITPFEIVMKGFPYLTNIGNIIASIFTILGEELNNVAMIAYMSYIITMVLIHLMVDTILFIPRFVNHLMDKQI